MLLVHVVQLTNSITWVRGTVHTGGREMAGRELGAVLFGHVKHESLIRTLLPRTCRPSTTHFVAENAIAYYRILIVTC